MTALFPILLAALLLARPILSNTEKTIFLAPAASVASSDGRVSLLPLQKLPALTPEHNTLRTKLPAIFPNATYPRGAATWFRLDGLEEGKRYEVRVCWAATQPTNFYLITHTLSDVLSNPELFSSLQSYAPSPSFASAFEPDYLSEKPTILLRIQAQADFYTPPHGPHGELMRSPQPVDADVILDPYILNVLPRSLLGTVIYITGFGIVSWFVARRIARWVEGVASGDRDGKGEKKE
ncbi:uncharacterized protein CTHT_0005170 [Thermochaetoides thermophila DSM 1495]|uniref:Uncharacterized protein n=1 Tax=Chaetomium thermophilum (strain DSM 1495 / CBS 144.50 / IMI 039719) TaxID=759272 RepID=G0RY27_CHATD|nr:hypothetical protein CTHT_0005170 [Thermochaetoides thermophila DSM 1495]EGS23813.1 hypothetical protein CTHT_0005170 [Thermochaetoides thermophila DSM 1495]